MRTSKRIHNICYLEREGAEDTRQLLNLTSGQRGVLLVWIDSGELNQYDINVASLEDYLKHPVWGRHKNNRYYVYIPQVKIIGKPDDIRAYLNSKGLSQRLLESSQPLLNQESNN